MMKKSIWTIYYLFLIISFTALVVAGLIKHRSLHQNLYAEQAGTLKIYSQSFESRISEQELLLDILGEKLLENELYLNQSKVHEFLKKLMKTKPSLAGFGLLGVDGNFITTSSNLTGKGLPNLKELEATREDFKLTLQSQSLVIGKTYFFKALNDWVIPLRKTLRDKNGDAIAVMTTGIKLSDSTKFLATTFTKGRRFLVTNPQNNYRVFASGIPRTFHKEFFNKPISAKVQLAIANNIKELYGFSSNDIKKQANKVFHFENIAEFQQTLSIASITYNKRYNLWMLIIDPKKTIQSQFIYAVFVYIILFILLQIVVLYFVRIIESNEKKTLDSLTYQATHDPLTGLYNRNYLEQKFAEIVAESSGEISLLFIDLDNFKNINDTYGHYTGDKLLIQVADRLKAFIPDAEKIIRFGGDEFVIVLQNQVPKDIEIANQLIETISVSYLIDNLNFTIGASIGIAREAAHNCNFDSLLSHADLAMYEAKKRKNSVVVFSEKLETQFHKTTEMEHHLRISIENQEIYLNYQPQVNKNGELYGVECLARWNSVVLGFVPPDEFIHSAESIGFMPMLGHHITHTALSEISELQDKLQQRFHVSINISIKQFMQDNFVKEFLDCVIRSGIPRKFITIEVTESLFIEDVELILSILDQFRRHQISVSLDDFGTGYSSLSLLRQLPIQELKIDKAFVDDILDDKKDSALVRNIIDIANEFGMYTLAEGVETAEQLEKLNVYNCNLFQGYYFSKPLSLIDLEAFIKMQSEETT